jgi:hypothetical protein
MRKSLIALCALGALGGVALLAAQSLKAREPHPVWSEVKWPFLMDQWGVGHAFQCKAEDCGTEINVYLRAKIGFCNCSTGVSDDDELDRVGDVELLAEQYKAPAPGHEIAVAWMKGRSRAYDVPGRLPGSTLAIAFNDHCDVIVATAVVANDAANVHEADVLAFLNSDTVLRWAEKTLGL